MFQDPFFLRVINRADFKGTKEEMDPRSTANVFSNAVCKMF